MSAEGGEGSRAAGLLAAGAALLIWAGFALVTRYGLRGQVQPQDMLALRFAVAGLIMLPVFVRNRFAGLRLWQVCAITVLGGIGFSSLGFIGFTLAPAAHAGVLLPGMLPFYTAILGALFLGERLGGMRAAGLALIFAGIVALGLSSLTQAALPHQWLGDLAFMAASLSWSVFTVLIRRWNISPVNATALLSVPSMAVYIPFYLAFLPVHITEWSWTEIAFYGVYQGIFAVICSVIAFSIAVRNIGATAAASITSGVPAIVTVAAIPLLGEVPTSLTTAGVVLAVAGMLVSVQAVRRGPAVSLRHGAAGD